MDKLNAGGLPAEHSILSNNHNLKAVKDPPKKMRKKSKSHCAGETTPFQGGLGICNQFSQMSGSELSVHSMMVTDEEKSNYISSNASINQEKGNVKGKSSLLQYKTVYGLSSTDCIVGPSVNGKTKNDIKRNLEEFSNANLNIPKQRHAGKGKNSPSQRKHNLTTAKSQSSGKSSTSEEEAKASAGDSKGQRKRRKSEVQQGLVLEVAKLHSSDSSGKRRGSKAGLVGGGGGGRTTSNTHLNSSESKNSSPRLPVNDGVARLTPPIYIAKSPSPSWRSESVGGSDASSIYHSSYIYQSGDRRCSDGVLLGIQRDTNSKKLNREMSLSATPPQRVQSAMDTHSSKELLPSPQMYSKMRRASAAADVFRTSLPYIPSNNNLKDNDSRKIVVDDAYANEVLDPGLLCAPGLGNVCGSTGPEEKDINDQTCRSNFGIILSVLCFILFLWYLGMVYSRFINQAFHLGAIESFMTPLEPEAIQEVFINISASDLKLVSHSSP